MPEIELNIIPKKELKELENGVSLTKRLKLNLSDDKKQTIADHCLEKIDEILSQRKELEDKIKTLRNQYFGMVKPKVNAYLNSFNVHVPLTKKTIDGAVSQTLEAFEDVDPKWVIPSRNKDEYEFREQQEKTLDYYSDTGMEQKGPWEKTLHDAYLLGNGWLGMPYVRKTEPMVNIKKYSSLEQFVETYPDPEKISNYDKIVGKLMAGEIVWLEEKIKKLVCDNPLPEHYEWEDIIVPLETKLFDNNIFTGLNNSRLVGRYVEYSWEEIYKLEKSGDFEDGVSEKLKYTNEWDKDTGEYKIDPEYLKKMFKCYEVQYFVDTDNDDIEERCLFLFEKEKKLTLQAINYPYNDGKCYIIPVVISHTKPGVYQEGLGEPLQPINIVLNAIVNHTLDASLLANSLTPIVKEKSGALEQLLNHVWYPGRPLVVRHIDDIKQLTFGTPNLAALLNLFVLMERFGEDISGMVNYLIGKESPDDPDAPASKTMALMRKAEIRLRRYVNNIKDSINEAGYQAIMRIYQFKGEKELSEILGKPVEDIRMYSPSQIVKPQAQAAGFAIEKIFQFKDAMMMFNMLMQEPEINQDSVKRMRLYRKVAKIKGENWEKMIYDIIPTEEELERKKFLRRHLQKKMQLQQNVAQKAKQNGMMDEQIPALAKEAGERYDKMAGVSPQELEDTQEIMQREMAMMAANQPKKRR